MDTRNPIWYGQLQLSGVGEPKNHSGSIVGIMGEILKDLQQLSPRVLAAGEKEIVIRFRDKPFGETKEFNRNADIAAEIWSQIDESQIDKGPNPSETYEQYVERLVERGMAEVTALYIAADWFNMPEPEGLRDWMADEKAIRFRKLNSSQEAYASALPMEYETLKHYIVSTYPQFADNITFRTA